MLETTRELSVRLGLRSFSRRPSCGSAPAIGGPEMLRIEMSEVINRPVEDVWRVVTNFDNWAKAARSRSEFRQTSEGPLGVGATVESRRAWRAVARSSVED